MRVSAVVAQYIAYKRSLGMRFNTEARALKSFCCYVRDIPLSRIESAQVRAFLDGRGPVTRFWHHKYAVLRGFYRYAIARGHTNTSPLPNVVPKAPPAFVPYIFSRGELRRLVQAAEACQNTRSRLQPETFRTLLLLLYGAALRIRSAVAHAGRCRSGKRGATRSREQVLQVEMGADWLRSAGRLGTAHPIAGNPLS
jgi:integrase/recombinase XerD